MTRNARRRRMKVLGTGMEPRESRDMATMKKSNWQSPNPRQKPRKGSSAAGWFATRKVNWLHMPVVCACAVCLWVCARESSSSEQPGPSLPNWDRL
jgi:hypothetical protein